MHNFPFSIEYPKNFPYELFSKSSTIAKWADSIDPSIHVLKLRIMSVDVFPGPKIGFIEAEATYIEFIDDNIETKNQKEYKISRFLISNGSSMILPIIKCKETGEIFTILVRQPRIGCGKLMYEFPSGMIEPGSNFKAAALQEFLEECNIKVDESDLVDLGKLFYDDTSKDLSSTINNIKTSKQNSCIFATNHYITADSTSFFAIRMKMSQTEISHIEGKCGGADPDEQITQHIIKLRDVCFVSNDVSTLALASVAYQLIKSGKMNFDF
ncbi:hypothetical protein TRFO_28239 [Tritrichomonas foetus]|uniref:Nudix hydrolase domain-containing protein n=1 Tax=Tritrichomonas foetus TaxID=1144522 RepID=A0A1J4JZ93_9EUKA|nr:hypothetical protein TRFO_28239 [Tritrichomonas foetus]|eukprot:OHT04299.1 hypothetical protein TRFO_28239 [Tritrichomonas foetus]